jgi:hypothetical protein
MTVMNYAQNDIQPPSRNDKFVRKRNYLGPSIWIFNTWQNNY